MITKNPAPHAAAPMTTGDAKTYTITPGSINDVALRGAVAIIENAPLQWLPITGHCVNVTLTEVQRAAILGLLATWR